MVSPAPASSLRWTIGRKLGASFLAVGLAVGTIGLVSYRSVDGLDGNAGMVDHTYAVLTTLDEVRFALTQAEAGQRGFLLTGDDSFLAPYTAAGRTLDAAQAKLRSLTADNPHQQQRLDALGPLVETRLSGLATNIELRRATGIDGMPQAGRSSTGPAVMTKANTVLDAMSAEERSLLDVRTATMDRSARTTKEVILFGSLLVLVGMVLLCRELTRRITRPVGAVTASLVALAEGDLTHDVAVRTTDETSVMAHALNTALTQLRDLVGAIGGSATTLASASGQVQQATSQIAVTAEQTSSQAVVAAVAAEQVSRNVQTVATGGEEMGASIAEIARNADEAARVAGEAVSVAEATNGTVARLGESSREIGDVVKVIASIAEQTNLLALNATIEAARAGSAGKGFAVVATEVKELAQETARATEDISRRVEAIQGDTLGAVAAIGEIAQVIARINDYQVTIAGAVEEQSATTTEMSRNVGEAALGSTSIAENVAGLASAAQHTASAVAESERTAVELQRLSGQLSGLVSRFRV